MTVLQVSLEEQLLAAAEQRARVGGTSLSALVRGWLSSYAGEREAGLAAAPPKTPRPLLAKKSPPTASPPATRLRPPPPDGLTHQPSVLQHQEVPGAEQVRSKTLYDLRLLVHARRAIGRPATRVREGDVPAGAPPTGRSGLARAES